MRRVCIAALTVGALTAGYAAGAERNVYFGDLHIHTRFSLDAFMFGTRSSPDVAYRYARGGGDQTPRRVRDPARSPA